MYFDPSLFLLIIIGLASGVIAGLIGMGGGIILTPICLIAYPILFPELNINEEVLTKSVFGTNFFVIIVSTFISTYQFNKKGLVIWKAAIPIAGFSVVGVIIGVLLAQNASADLLQKIFGIFALITAIRLQINIKSDVNKPEVYSYLIYMLLGVGASILGALIGVGGGIIVIPVLLLILNYPAVKVPGTSSSIIFVTSLTSLIGYIYIGIGNPALPAESIGYLYLPAAIPLAIGAGIGAPIGTWLNTKVSDNLFRTIFSLLLVFVFIKMIFF